MSKEKLKELSYEELLNVASKYEEYYSKVKEGAKKYVNENQNVRLYHSCKSNAKKKGIYFDLTIEDFVFPETCPFLGIKLTNTTGEGRVKSNVSIDRIDPSKGYIKGNIQFISDLANRMKQNASKEELLKFAEGINKIYGGL